MSRVDTCSYEIKPCQMMELYEFGDLKNIKVKKGILKISRPGKVIINSPPSPDLPDYYNNKVDFANNR